MPPKKPARKAAAPKVVVVADEENKQGKRLTRSTAVSSLMALSKSSKAKTIISKPQPKKRFFSELPELAVLNVFAHVPYNDMLRSAVQVSHHWRRLALEQLARRRELNLLIGVEDSYPYYCNYTKPHSLQHFDPEDARLWRDLKERGTANLLRLASYLVRHPTDALKLADRMPRIECLRVRIESQGSFRNFRTGLKEDSAMHVSVIDCLVVRQWSQTLVTLNIAINRAKLNTEDQADRALHLLRGLNTQPMPGLRHLRFYYAGELLANYCGPTGYGIELPVMRRLETLHFRSKWDSGQELFNSLIRDGGGAAPNLRSIKLDNRFYTSDMDDLIKLLSEHAIRPKLRRLRFSVAVSQIEALEQCLRCGTQGTIAASPPPPPVGLTSLWVALSMEQHLPKPTLGRLSRLLSPLPALETVKLSLELHHYLDPSALKTQGQLVALPTVTRLELFVSTECSYQTDDGAPVKKKVQQRQDGQFKRFATSLVSVLPSLTECRIAQWKWSVDDSRPRRRDLTKKAREAMFDRFIQHMKGALEPRGCQLDYDANSVPTCHSDFDDYSDGDFSDDFDEW